MSLCNFCIGLAGGLIGGWILGYLFFGQACRNKGPDSNMIKKKVYQYGEKFYKFDVIPFVCPPSHQR